MQHSKPSSSSPPTVQRGGRYRVGRSQRPQKTISELFTESKAHREASDRGSFPPSKRLKLDHTSQTDCTLQKPINPDDMYNFSKPNHVDLTGADGAPKPSPLWKQAGSFNRPPNFSTQSGPKKLIVKNLKKTSKGDSDQYYDHVWTQLDAALSAIFVGEKVQYSLEELYRGVEISCRQGQAPALFQKLSSKCKDGISAHYEKPLVAAAPAKGDVEILGSIVEAWARWNTQLARIRSIFIYMDRSYLLHSSSLPSIESMGFTDFREHVFCNENLRNRILRGACHLVNLDRDGHGGSSNDDLFQHSIKMFHALGVYTIDFEPELLAQSSTYFSSWSEEQAASSNLATYIEECQSLINRERQRCEAFELDSSTRRQIELYLEDLLIDERQTKLLESRDVISLLDNNAVDNLDHLYSLLQRRHLEEKLKFPFESYINEQGSQIVFDEEHEQQMVVRLLQFKVKLDLIWERSFALHEGLGHSLREAFEAFINKSKKSPMTWGTDNLKPGEMIAKHVDLILKGGSKAAMALTSSGAGDKTTPAEADVDESSEDEDVEINKQLDQVLDLFRFVHGKAVFEAFYKRDLARRLLLNRSASAAAEKSMLTRLKTECGASFTHNLEQMFKDMELAREEVSSYKMMLEDRTKALSAVHAMDLLDKPLLDLNVSVLSASAWPSYPDVAVEIPRDVQKACVGFEQYYRLKHTGRKLAWKHSLAHCQLKASFSRGNKELIVSSYQTVVLLVFNERSGADQVPYTEIQGATNLNDMELKRTLQSLACAKYRVLSKTPKGKDVNQGDTFSINTNFSDPKYRIKINQVQAKETKEENKETHERVAADRSFETQAAIVRIMKSRKTITHAELVSEVISATKSRGVMDTTDIKKNIEKLIDKDYMERDEKSEVRNVYNYLA